MNLVKFEGKPDSKLVLFWYTLNEITAEECLIHLLRNPRPVYCSTTTFDVLRT